MAKVYSILCIVVFAMSCSGNDQFSSYQRETFDETQIGASETKQIVLANPSLTNVQHVTGLDFDAGTNGDGNFIIDRVEVGGVSVNPRNRDISVPAGSILQISITYQPLNLNTTIASYGGWSTGQEERYEPQAPEAISTISTLITSRPPPAIHRAILAIVYDHPQKGVVQIEVVGEAVPGPNGEISAAGGPGSGECPNESGTLCYAGGFTMELPDIATTGPRPLTLTGPIVFTLAGSTVSLDMDTFPSALLVLSGNGPGEPLEGKPISAISIIISGTEGTTATGTFDGSRLTVRDVSFRIRVILGEIEVSDITPGLQSAVDFNVGDLTITTSRPATNGSVELKIEATLDREPSGNPMFDQFLGGTRILVTMDGNITIK